MFVVDNSDEDWKVVRYLHDWCQLSRAIDVATANFESGGLRALLQKSQEPDKRRVLMGDEVAKRTKVAWMREITRRVDASLEAEKRNDACLERFEAVASQRTFLR